MAPGTESSRVDRRRTVIHIGLHKTGTTYLQGAWAANRAALAEQGVYYPGDETEPSQRLAFLDALGHRPRGARDARLPGSWRALASAVAASSLPVALLSAEGLSVATARQAQTIVAGFPGRDVEVLVTARDLGRVLVSSWQEAIKNDGTWTWPEYSAAVQDPARRGRRPARGFWLAQDLPAILATWAQAVPAERIYVVTVPPAGAAPEELLRRVGGVVGFEPATLTQPGERDNTSLGVAGTEVVRRLNVALGHKLNQRQHDHVVKSVLVRDLVKNGTDVRYSLPEQDLDWAEREARCQIAAVRAADYPVVGDLDDLLPAADPAARTPADVTTDELLDAALLGLSGLTARHATQWWKRRKDDPVVDDAARPDRVGSALRALTFRTRRAAAALADYNTWAAKVAAKRLDDRRN